MSQDAPSASSHSVRASRRNPSVRARWGLEREVCVIANATGGTTMLGARKMEAVGMTEGGRKSAAPMTGTR